MRILDAGKSEHWRELLALFTADLFDSTELDQAVREILTEVRTGGDDALIALARKFDGIELRVRELAVSESDLLESRDQVSKEFLEAIATMSRNLEDFHKRQIEASWGFERNGVRLGQRVVPLDSVGIYVPGGRALYPSTVLMMAIPARLAGVSRVVMVTPPRPSGVDSHLLAAAHQSGVTEIYQVGGAQAIAALAFGTATIPRVDKIVGPGNLYVAAAKRMVFGLVDIDNVAGPSEIAVLADDTANPEWIARDLISQLEHDIMAKAVLVTPSTKLSESVVRLVGELAPNVARARIVEQSVRDNCVAFIVASLEEGISAINRIAPEHLEVVTDSAATVAERITNAGCIFIGPYSPVPMGDYIAGTNHTLPTGRTARFGSPLGVTDFCKRIDVVEYSQEGFLRESKFVETMAEVEDLPNHGETVRVRRSRVPIE